MNDNKELEEYYEQKIKEFKEITESTDYNSIDLNDITHEELEKILLEGAFDESAITFISNYINKSRTENKSVEQTIDELMKIDIYEEVKKQKETPLTFQRLKESMSNIRGGFNKLFIDFINKKQKEGASIEETYEGCEMLLKAIEHIKIEKNCHKCGKNIVQVYIAENRKSYCKRCSKNKKIILTATNK